MRGHRAEEDRSRRYIIARREVLSAEQKELIVDFVMREMLGISRASTQEELKRFISERKIRDEETIHLMQESIENGLTVYSDEVSLADGEELVYLLNDLWDELEEFDDSAFVRVDTSLD